MKSYLITGGAGFIGSHLGDALLDRGDRIVVLDNFVSGRPTNLPVDNPRLKILAGDVRRIEDHSVEIGEVDAIIHLAALISGYDSLGSPGAYIDVNVSGLQHVIDFAGRRNVARLVFASSSTVYGNAALSPIDEKVIPNPITVYAASKLMGEYLLSMYSNLHGYTYCNLRLFNVYGPRQAIDHPYANVTCKFSHAAANSLPIKKYGDGRQSRDFIYVEDVVNAFVAVLDGKENATYNVGTGHSASINSLIANLEEITGHALQCEVLDPWPNDIRHIEADVGKLIADFGVRPNIELREGLARTVGFFEGVAAQA